MYRSEPPPNAPQAFGSRQGSEPGYTDYFRVNPRCLSVHFAHQSEAGFRHLPPPGNFVQVEEKLLEHPAVGEAGVVGNSEAVKAYISLREGFLWSEKLEQELKNWVKDTLSARLVPQEITVWDRLPKTRSGKVLRHALRSMEKQ